MQKGFVQVRNVFHVNAIVKLSKYCVKIKLLGKKEVKEYPNVSVSSFGTNFTSNVIQTNKKSRIGISHKNTSAVRYTSI